MQRCAGKKREPPPHNLESAERRREGALLETRPRASQGIWDPAAPPRRGVVPECRRRRCPRSPPPARRRAHGGVAKNTPAFTTLRRRRTRRVVIGSGLNFWGESTSPEKARRPVELRGRPRCTAYLPNTSRRAERRRDAIAGPSRTPGQTMRSEIRNPAEIKCRPPPPHQSQIQSQTRSCDTCEERHARVLSPPTHPTSPLQRRESLVCVKTLASRRDFPRGVKCLPPMDFPKTGHKRYQFCLAYLWSIGFGSPIGFRLGFGSPFEQANGSVHARHESSAGMQPYA